MTEAHAIHPKNGATDATGQVHAATSPTSSVEFRALLDRLREQAASLERASDGPLRAEELSGAVEQAGASLVDALSIAEGLLEAYRSSRMRNDGASDRAPRA